MKHIISRDVSRPDINEIGAARAKIALHHFYGFTGFNPVFSRLLSGLERRKLIARRPSCRS